MGAPSVGWRCGSHFAHSRPGESDGYGPVHQADERLRYYIPACPTRAECLGINCPGMCSGDRTVDLLSPQDNPCFNIPPLAHVSWGHRLGLVNRCHRGVRLLRRLGRILSWSGGDGKSDSTGRHSLCLGVVQGIA